jgi:cyclase
VRPGGSRTTSEGRAGDGAVTNRYTWPAMNASKTSPRLRKVACGFLAAALVIAKIAPAQQPTALSKTEIKATRLAPDFYTLEGAGGTISVLVGRDGVLLVDTEYAALTDRVVAAIKRISDQPIRIAINTHVHADHAGGNENLAKLGVIIFSRDQVRERLDHPNPAADGTPGKPAPALALPAVTYNGPVSIHFDGENVRLLPIRNAHTDGDTLIIFPKHDIFAVGDFYRGIGYPFADLKRDGSLQGILDGLAFTLGLAGPHTKIIPGHGPVTDRNGLIEQRDMILRVRDKVAALVNQDKTLEEVFAAKPTAEFDARVRGDASAAAFVTGDEFVAWVYKELQPGR